jgi:hypothetical protein
VRVYPYKLITTIRNFTARMYLHLLQAPHSYIAAPTSIILYGATTNNDNPLLANMGLERRAGLSGAAYGGVSFFDRAGGGVEK